MSLLKRSSLSRVSCRSYDKQDHTKSSIHCSLQRLLHQWVLQETSSVTTQCFRKQNQVGSRHFESRSLPQGLAYGLGLRHSAYFRKTVWLEGSKHRSQTKFSDLPGQKNHFQRFCFLICSTREQQLASLAPAGLCTSAQRTKGWSENLGCGAMVGQTPATHSLTHILHWKTFNAPKFMKWKLPKFWSSWNIKQDNFQILLAVTWASEHWHLDSRHSATGILSFNLYDSSMSKQQTEAHTIHRKLKCLWNSESNISPPHTHTSFKETQKKPILHTKDHDCARGT